MCLPKVAVANNSIGKEAIQRIEPVRNFGREAILKVRKR